MRPHLRHRFPCKDPECGFCETRAAADATEPLTAGDIDQLEALADTEHDQKGPQT